MSTLLPVGFRFHPKDHELVSFYLYNKVNGHPPAFFVLPEADVYVEEPWEIWKRLGEQVDDEDSLYFFTIPKKVNPKGKRIDRRTKSRLGTWSEGEPSKPVCDVNGKPIGTKRKFWWESEHSLHHAAWHMEEYNSNFSPDWVVCHLRKNKRPSSESNQSNDTSRSTGVKCIKPKNSKRSRTEDHQQVVNSSLMNVPSNNKDDPSTSTDMEYIMPQNKRLRKHNVPNNQVVENTLINTPSSSNYSYFERELPQCSTTTEDYQQFTIGEIFHSTADPGNFVPISDVEVIDWDILEVIDWDNISNYYVEDLQQSTSCTNQQTNVATNSDIVQTNVTTNSDIVQTNVANNSDIVGGHDHGNVIPIHDANGVDNNYWDNLLKSSPADQ